MIKIICPDGRPESLEIIDTETGQGLTNVDSVEIYVDKGGMAAKITFNKVKFDINAEMLITQGIIKGEDKK
jgi:hypothetical protein